MDVWQTEWNGMRFVREHIIVVLFQKDSSYFVTPLFWNIDIVNVTPYKKILNITFRRLTLFEIFK